MVLRQMASHEETIDDAWAHDADRALP
jgi:hypothetical protein